MFGFQTQKKINNNELSFFQCLGWVFENKERKKERFDLFQYNQKSSKSQILRWCGVFLEQILSKYQFKMHFIEIFVVETKQFVGSFVIVILPRQTCGQRSSRAAESKRRALGNLFPERICNMFLISKCRGDWDLVLCTVLVLAFGRSMRIGDIRKENVSQRRKNRILLLRISIPNESTEIELNFSIKLLKLRVPSLQSKRAVLDWRIKSGS